METEVEKLIWSLEAVLDATNEHDKAREEYQGYSWGYAGAGLIYERDKARKDFAANLLAVIDARVASALEARAQAQDKTDAR